MVLKGVVFLRGPVYCCTVPDVKFCLFLANCAVVTRTNRVVFERNLYLLTLRIALLLAASSSSGRVVPENSRIALVIRSGL